MKKITRDFVKNCIPKRNDESHKGDYGRVLIIAGSRTMTGACIMSCLAALRSGAGLVYAYVPEEIMTTIQVSIPEAIVLPRIKGEKIDYSRYDAIAVGPGLGTWEDSQLIVEDVIEHANCPVVLDADALNIVAKYSLQEKIKTRTKAGLEFVMTPHLGEAERLVKHREKFAVGLSTRENILNVLYYDTNSTVVLKGHRTLVRPLNSGPVNQNESIMDNTTGNPGMATAGSGDVLTGVIASFLAQHIKNAAACGVYMHGLAGDMASKVMGEYSLIATDIIRFMPKAFEELNRKE